jgi:hypothetical protein
VCDELHSVALDTADGDLLLAGPFGKLAVVDEHHLVPSVVSEDVLQNSQEL